MKLKKVLALFLTVTMLLSFSTMFVSAVEERSINYPKTWIDVGETMELPITVPSGASAVTWASDNTSVATINQNGEVTGVSRGENLLITATYTVNGVETVEELYINVYDSRGIVSGEEYYIKNVNSNKVLSLASTSDTNNTVINTSARSISTTKQWRLTKQSTGQYTFVSVYSSAGRGMYVNSSVNDVYLYNRIGSSSSIFELERINSGTYYGTYRIRYNGKYLAADSSNDVYLTTTLNGSCYWSFSRVDKRTADHFAHKYYYTNSSGTTKLYDTTDNYSGFVDVFSNFGYSINYAENGNPQTAYDNLSESTDIFIFRGHGTAGRIAFKNNSGTTIGRIVADSSVPSPSAPKYPIEQPNNPNYLASARCVLYIACSTALSRSNGSNLLNSTYEYGAHFVLGLTENVSTDKNDEWLGLFLDYVDGALTLKEAVIYATMDLSYITKNSEESDEGSGSNNTGEFSYPYEYIGDDSQTLN